jgi:hypothetical protein
MDTCCSFSLRTHLALPEGSSMIESTLGIMTFFEWAFALASLSEGLGFSTFLHNSTEVQGKSEDLQAKQFELSWLSGLLCLKNITKQARTQRRPYRSFGSGPRRDILVVASPIYSSNISSQLIAFVDSTFSYLRPASSPISKNSRPPPRGNRSLLLSKIILRKPPPARTAIPLLCRPRS